MQSCNLRRSKFEISLEYGQKMPTATDVDNRPVTIGKWPRLRRNHTRENNALRRQRQPQIAARGQHSDWCALENCLHNYDEDSSNVDVLLHPELLQEYNADKCKLRTT